MERRSNRHLLVTKKPYCLKGKVLKEEIKANRIRPRLEKTYCLIECAQMENRSWLFFKA
jgi:hypothetical protein